MQLQLVLINQLGASCNQELRVMKFYDFVDGINHMHVVDVMIKT